MFLLVETVYPPDVDLKLSMFAFVARVTSNKLFVACV